MTIALDFDGTFTADEAFWAAFVQLAQAHGHKVIGVTQRRNTEENREIVQMPVPVYFTDLAPKWWAMEQRGVKVDVWIDDDLKAAFQGH